MSGWNDKEILAQVEKEEKSTRKFKIKSVGQTSRIEVRDEPVVEVNSAMQAVAREQKDYEKAVTTEAGMKEFSKTFADLMGVIADAPAKGAEANSETMKKARKLVREMLLEVAKTEGANPGLYVSAVGGALTEAFAVMNVALSMQRVDKKKAGRSEKAMQASVELINRSANTIFCETFRSLHDFGHKTVDRLTGAMIATKKRGPQPANTVKIGELDEDEEKHTLH